MLSKAQSTGMRGVYLVSAELARQGFIASPTSRSARGADILATSHDCNRSFSVQVKTKTTKDPSFLLGHHAKTIVAKSHVYVLVQIKSKKGIEEISYYPIPSKYVSKNATEAFNGYLMRVPDIQKFKNNWKPFGNPDLSPKKSTRINRRQ